MVMYIAKNEQHAHAYIDSKGTLVATYLVQTRNINSQETTNPTCIIMVVY